MLGLGLFGNRIPTSEKIQQMPKSRAVTKLWPPITDSVKQVALRVLSADVAQADPFCWSHRLKPSAISTWFLRETRP